MIQLRTFITALIVLVLGVTLFVMAFATMSVAERTILPELQKQASTIARSHAALISRALDAGIPLDRLVGVDSYFVESLAQNDAMARITLTRPDGSVLVQSVGTTPAAAAKAAHLTAPPMTWPVRLRGETVALVAVDVDPSAMDARIHEIWIDQGIIIFVSIFISLELVALTFARRIGRSLSVAERRLKLARAGNFAGVDPSERHDAINTLARPLDRLADRLAARSAALLGEALRSGHAGAVRLLDRIADRFGVGRVAVTEENAAERVRTPLFVFMLSEELTRAFVPHTARHLGEAVGTLPVEMIVGLPIAIFMMVVALSQPILGPIVHGLGRRRMFLVGATTGMVGHFGSALAGDWYAFLACRGLTAVGYALVFVAAQSAIADDAPPGGRSRAFSLFVRAITVAGLCGPPIGGIIADRLGAQVGFAAAGLVAAVSLWLGRSAIADAATVEGGKITTAPLKGFRTVVSDPLLVGLVFLCALPAKLMLVGFCFYLVPVRLEQDGFSLAVVGRLQMLYPIVMVLAVPVFAYMADRAGKRAPFVIAGGIVAGLAALYPFFETAPITLAAALIQLGFGQAISIASQTALVTEYGAQLRTTSGTVLGLFRLVERTGNALGPIAAAAVLATMGFETASLMMGGLVIFGVITFFIIEKQFGSARDVPAGESK